jgi:hypothetical protein
VGNIIFDYVILMAAKKGKDVGCGQVIGLQGHEDVSSRWRRERKGVKA